MKRTLLLLFLITGCTVFGQVQKGYVKTPGRYDHKGEAVGGVIIRARGNHNDVLSDKNGIFALPMQNIKNGEPYVLERIYKSGYVLLEPDMIGRELAFSNKVALTLVMMLNAQLQEELYNMQESYQEELLKNYQEKINQLEKDVNDNIITKDFYDQKISELKAGFDNIQASANDLANYYVRLDYDKLDNSSLEIYRCIASGELDHAYELIKPFIDIIRQEKETLSAINKKEEFEKKQLEEANNDMMAYYEKQKKDAQYLYYLYTISSLKFDNNKALYYLEKRADLDSSVSEWQLDAGLFCMQYSADYDKAIVYLNHVIQNKSIQEGNKQSIILAAMGLYNIYNNMGFYNKAEDYYKMAHDIAVNDADYPYLAMMYNNCAVTFRNRGKYDDALDLFRKALDIYKSYDGFDAEVSTLYNNIGMIKRDQGLYQEALTYYEKSLNMRSELFGINSVFVAESYNNIGDVYGMMQAFDKSNEYLQKALEIRTKIYGDKHPLVAQTYSNIGKIYIDKSQADKALEYCSIAKYIYEELGMDDYLDAASNYLNYGNANRLKGYLDTAKRALEKSLTVRQKYLPDDHYSIAESYFTLGSLYYDLGSYTIAKDYYQKALRVFENNPSINAKAIKQTKQYIKELNDIK